MAKTDDLTVGDLVKLKSGSPALTVERIKKDKAECVWYNEKEGFFRTASFAKNVLIKQNEVNPAKT